MLKKVFLGLSLLIFITGCTLKQEVTQEEFDQIIINQTTKKDIQKMFGAADMETGMRNELWSYHYVIGKDAFGSDIRQTVTFEFDKDWIVIKKLKTVWPKSVLE